MMNFPLAGNYFTIRKFTRTLCCLTPDRFMPGPEGAGEVPEQDPSLYAFGFGRR